MKKMTNRLTATVAVAAITASTIFSGGVVFAATDGLQDVTSTGTTVISVTKTKVAMITGMTDLTLGAWQIGDAAPQLTTDACIYADTVGGGYKVTASGDGTASAFTLSDGAAHTLPYSVAWNSLGGGNLTNVGTALVTTVQSGAKANADTASLSCATAGPTARLIVGVLNADLIAVPAGAYTGTLTIVITPV